MASTDLPSSTVTVSAQATASGAGDGYIAVITPVATLDDYVPRLYATGQAALAAHGYSPGISYGALHAEKCKKPFLLVPVPIATAGTVAAVADHSATGTSTVTVAAGGDGALEACDVILTVVTGGTRGTAGIVLDLSLDGGATSTTIRLGTATSYAVPNLGFTISFGAGTLVADDYYTFQTTAPMWNSAGLTLARAGLAAKNYEVRSWLVDGDLNPTFAGYVGSAAASYASSNKRFVMARASTTDKPTGVLAKTRNWMSGAPNVTFAEVGGTGDTITRSAGSFITDGYVAGDTIVVAGAVDTGGANNVTGVPANIAATVLTMNDTDLVNEGPIAGVSIYATPTLTFAANGGSPDTCTRNRGSWIDEGFKVGDAITITGTSLNNVSSVVITVLTPTVLTVATGNFADEVIGSYAVTMASDESTWALEAASQNAEYVAVTSTDGRLSLGFGRRRILCPLTSCAFRRSPAWAASLREYEPGWDIHNTSWRYDRGALSDWFTISDDVEHDERIDGGALAGSFTCFTTLDNEGGIFIAKDLTRASSDSVLFLPSNVHVVNAVCTIVQKETTRLLGQDLIKQSDNTIDPNQAVDVEEAVNGALKRGIMRQKVPGRGARASSVRATLSRDDDLSGADATLTWVVELNLKGVVSKVTVLVRAY
jgi:hypothetical protein